MLHAMLRITCLLIIIVAYLSNKNISEHFSISYPVNNANRFLSHYTNITEAVTFQNNRRLFGSNDLKRSSCKLYEKVAQNDSSMEVCCIELMKNRAIFSYSIKKTFDLSYLAAVESDGIRGQYLFECFCKLVSLLQSGLLQ